MVSAAAAAVALALLVGAADAEALSVSPASLTFPNTKVGKTSAPQAVTLTACPGAYNCIISSVNGNFYDGFTAVCPSSTGNFALACAPSTEFLQTNNCPPSGFPPGTSCTMWIYFKPDARGARAATLHSGYDLISSPLTSPPGAKAFVGGYGLKRKKGRKKPRRQAAQRRQE